MNQVLNQVSDHDEIEIRALTSVSAQIRYVAGSMYPDSKPNYYQVAKELTRILGRNVRPQHARNVLVTPLKKGQ